MSHPDFREYCPGVLVSQQFVLNRSCIILFFSRVQKCGESGVWQVVGRMEGLKDVLFPLLPITDLSDQWCQIAVIGQLLWSNYSPWGWWNFVISLQSLTSPQTILPSLLLFNEVVVSKYLHILLQAIMFSVAFADLSHSFPISSSKYQYEKGKDITPLIKLYFFLFLHCPSWKLLIFLAQPWSSTQKDTSTHAEKMNCS